LHAWCTADRNTFPWGNIDVTAYFAAALDIVVAALVHQRQIDVTFLVDVYSRFSDLATCLELRGH
jgi:hypothetical protein